MTTKTIDTVNTSNTTKDPRSDATAGAAIEPPITHKTQPGLGVGHVPYETDLEARIKAHRTELLAKLVQLRANKRVVAKEAGDKLRAKLSELAHIIKDGVVDGWGSLTDTVKHRLEQWLAEPVQPHPTQNVPAGTRQS
jgi:hypothetical protein